MLQDPNANHFDKISLVRLPPKWDPPRSSQEKKVGECKRARSKSPIPDHPAAPPEPKAQSSRTETVDPLTRPYVSKQTQRRRKTMEDGRRHRSARNTIKQTPSSGTCKLLRRVKSGPDPATNVSVAAGCLTAALVSDPRVKDSGKLDQDERLRLLIEARGAKALVLTMVYQDGSTQLDPEQVSRGRGRISEHLLSDVIKYC